MAKAIRVTDRVLTPEQAEVRRRRLIALVEKVEVEIFQREGQKAFEQPKTEK